MSSNISSTTLTDVAGRKLVQSQTKRGKILVRLEYVAIINFILLLPAVVVLLLMLLRFLIPNLAYESPHDRRFFVSVSTVFLLNITAIITYFIAVVRKKKALLITYIVVNFVFIIMQICISLILYTGAQIRDDEKVSTSMTALFVVSLILIALNSVATSYVNAKVHRLTGYTKTFNNTLTNTISQSKTASTMKDKDSAARLDKEQNEAQSDKST